jgi:hypothetical protein
MANGRLSSFGNRPDELQKLNPFSQPRMLPNASTSARIGFGTILRGRSPFCQLFGWAMERFAIVRAELKRSLMSESG